MAIDSGPKLVTAITDSLYGDDVKGMTGVQRIRHHFQQSTRNVAHGILRRERAAVAIADEETARSNAEAAIIAKRQARIDTEAAADRYIIVAIDGRSGTGGRTLSSVTIGGVSASITAQITNAASGSVVCALVIAAVPTGATGDIVVTFSGAMVRMGIGVYRVTGLTSATATDTGSSTATNPTADLDIVAGGFAIGVAAVATVSTFGWTGITEDYDVNYNANMSHTGASDTFEAEQTGLTVTATPSSSSVPAGAFASWELDAVGGARRIFVT